VIDSNTKPTETLALQIQFRPRGHFKPPTHGEAKIHAGTPLNFGRGSTCPNRGWQRPGYILQQGLN
jgi:hypothetical protein